MVVKPDPLAGVVVGEPRRRLPLAAGAGAQGATLHAVSVVGPPDVIGVSPPSMECMSRQPGDMRPGGGAGPPGGNTSSNSNWRWVAVVLVTIGILAVVLSSMRSGSSATAQNYSSFLTALNAGQITEATVNKDNGHITYTNTSGQQFSVQGPDLNDNAAQLKLYSDNIKNLKLTTNSTSSWAAIIPYLLYGAVIILLFVWLTRRAQGQMSGIMSIGRSKAKVYTTERPRTTFADVAGYDGVKLEIREVVDFLRSANRFKEIGAKIPQGRPAGRTARDGQDPAGPGRGG